MPKNLTELKELNNSTLTTLALLMQAQMQIKEVQSQAEQMLLNPNVNAEALREQIKKAQELRENLNTDLDAFFQDLHHAQRLTIADLNTITYRLQYAINERNKLEKELKNAQDLIAQSQGEKRDLREWTDALKTELQTTKNEVETLKEALEEAEARREELESIVKIKEAQDLIAKYEQGSLEKFLQEANALREEVLKDQSLRLELSDQCYAIIGGMELLKDKYLRTGVLR